ncbi:MAG: glycosyl hydrolase [Thermomicrobiales bacterium]
MITVRGLRRPGREFSLLPFWFWNDDLDEAELHRQLADFARHGVYGVVLHPRLGLPRSIGWLSDRMLAFMGVAIAEARRLGMRVVLYDEGMYPSGSASGQVVARNPQHRCRGLACVTLDDGDVPPLAPDAHLVAVVARRTGARLAVLDRPVDAVIRGLHYVGDGPEEDTPPYADILNPAATASFIELVYDRYYAAFGDHFGRTVAAIFTDEPNPLGRCRERDVWPGTTGILAEVNALLGYDFTPHLPALWYDDEPDAARHRRDYAWAIDRRLEDTWYRPLHDWCAAHGLALAGHPARGDYLGAQRYFDIPGQDLVWRWVLPGTPSALEGPESTQAKCSSSAMLHLGRRRNSNECFGAYGHQFTWQEMKWLVDWCCLRGVNLLIPHAFYYSLRGPRRDERPPDVGPHSPWWSDYRRFARYCRRLCWLNTDSQHICRVAILGADTHLPWAAAKVCYQHQRDFNYLELRRLEEDAAVSAEGVRLAGMRYPVLVLDPTEELVDAVERAGPQARAALATLAAAGRLVVWAAAPAVARRAPLGLDAVPTAAAPEELVAALDRHGARDLGISPHHPGIRYRHVVKGGDHYYLLGNEGLAPVTLAVEVPVAGTRSLIDPLAGTETALPAELVLPPYTTRIIRVTLAAPAVA